MKAHTFYKAVLPILLGLAGCTGRGGGVGVNIACELSGSDIATDLASFTLTLYQDLPSGGSVADAQSQFCAGWDLAAPWSPTGGTEYDHRTGTSLSTSTFNFEVLPGRWGFTFVGVKSDFNPADPKDLARGCVVVDLVEGPNPQVVLKIKEIIWPIEPGVCGDGTVDPDELCDDGNTADDATCSADCHSMPVFQVNITTANTQKDPAIAASQDNYILAWTCGGSAAAGETDQHSRARRVDKYGGRLTIGTFDGEVKLNATSTVQGQYQPSVALGQGRFMALWIDTAPSTGVPPGDVVYRVFDVGATTWPGELTLNVDSAAGTQNWARVSGSGGLKFFAAWVTMDAAPRHAACSVYDVSTSLWSDEAACSEGSTDDESQVDTAMSFTGGHAAVWTRQGDIILQLFSAAGPRDGEEQSVNIPGAGVCDYPAAAYDGLGRLLVVWRYTPTVGNIEIRGRMYDAVGEPLSASDFTISTTALTGGAARPDDGKPAYIPDVAGDPGKFLAVWSALGAGGGRGRIVLGDDRFGVNRFIRAAPEDAFTSTDDFPITSQEFPAMDQFVVACAAVDFCMVAWKDESLIDDLEAQGIRAVIVPILQP